MKFKEVFGDYMKDQSVLFFSNLSNISTFEDDAFIRFIAEFDLADWMDINYFYTRGEKTCSAYIERMSSIYKPINFTAIDEISHFIYIQMRNKRNHLAQSFLQEYNVLQPYDVIESENINMSYDGNKSTNSKITTTNNGRTDDSIYGFNSSEAKGTTISADENSNIVQGSSDDNYETDNKTETGTKTRSKTGNLGNHSYAELISKDIEFWKNNLIEIIFKDVDKLLTCPLYSY